MMPPSPRDQLVAAVTAFLSDARFVTALTSTALGISVLAFALRQTIGWAGLVGMLVALLLLASATFIARRESVEWRGLLPISLLAFLGWTGLSLLWSQYHWASLAGLGYLAAFTLIGLFIALLRDTIQIVRVFGDVLRFALAFSLVVEIVAGVLIDQPIRFIAVVGSLDEFGPIQGIMGTRNQLGVLAVLAIVTFGTELRTRSVPRGMSIASLLLAGITLPLTRSPLAFGALLVECLSAAALYGLRRVNPT